MPATVAERQLDGVQWRRCNSTAMSSEWRRCNSTAMSSDWRRCNSTAMMADAGRGGGVQWRGGRCSKGDGGRRRLAALHSTAREDAGSGGDVQRSAWRRCNPTAADDRRRKQRRLAALDLAVGDGLPARERLRRWLGKDDRRLVYGGDRERQRNISHFLRIKRHALKDDMNSGALGNTSPESDTSLPSSALSCTVRQLQSTTALCSVPVKKTCLITKAKFSRIVSSRANLDLIVAEEEESQNKTQAESSRAGGSRATERVTRQRRTRPREEVPEPSWVKRIFDTLTCIRDDVCQLNERMTRFEQSRSYQGMRHSFSGGARPANSL
ncbi:unnamed protein product [Cuscuta campestris]|uniref:Uncharacterized protein n=1 Tax=Cuscuta campestris TaxID=132261 RepID=A0A484M431_9ASTE|nr:unnamed protein product [Cuscuta campestris]